MRMDSRGMLLIQVLIGLAIVAAAVWYVGVQGLGSTLVTVNPAYIGLCLIAYLAMNLLFAFRLIRVLGSMGFRIGFWRMLLIQFGGMLASDFTPARSGYFIVPVLLNGEGLPVTVGLSSILGCQSVEFLVKMFGGAMAIAYLASTAQLSQSLFILSIVGVALMLLGSGLIAAAMWWRRAGGILGFIFRVPLLERLGAPLLGKISEFQREAAKVKSIIHEITLLTVASWIVKGFEWYFIGLALGIGEISWLGYFLIHPLVTALSFIPLTPSGLGFQEGGIVGVLYLLGVDLKVGLAFAILARTLLILEDLIGIYPISKIGVRAFKTISLRVER
ncbi:flippase-like domain-containing protein [Candidatus Bathyarchaeota archaeon]|nr:flippase-like domain-containing protein [Candidatus Bathyarchaeota archaeon]